MNNSMTRGLKKTAAAMALAIGVVGSLVVPDAQALQFSGGDLVLAIYGNDKEYLRVLGQADVLTAPGNTSNFSISSTDLAQLNGPIPPATSPAPLRYSLFAVYLDEETNPNKFKFSSSKTASQITPAEQLLVNTTIGGNTAATLLAQGTGSPTPIDIRANTSTISFTSKFGTGGNFVSTIPFSGQGLLGQTLNFLVGDMFQPVGSNVVMDMGHAILSADGLSLLVSGNPASPVPLPAAVILFGTGLAGIVGLARRSKSV